jgi:hypothetical protein
MADQALRQLVAVEPVEVDLTESITAHGAHGTAATRQ